MHKYLEELLQGETVEWKTLGEIFNIKNGYTPSKNNKDYWENGTISWFRMEDIRENGRILKESLQKVTSSGVKGNLFEENSIIISTSATIGEHALIKKPFLANQRFTCLSLKEKYKTLFDIKFVFHYCFLLGDWCKENTTQSSFSSVDMKRFREFEFPIPPLKTQQKIVDILDKLCELKTALKTALKTERDLRLKQYEYYRDKLLTFGDEVEWKELGEVCSILRGKRVIKSQLSNLSGFPVYQNSLSSLGYFSEYNCSGNNVFIISAGAAGEIGYCYEKFWAADDCLMLETTLFEQRFLYHYFMNIKNKIKSFVRKASVPRLSRDSLNKIKIPILSLEKQKQIADTLDKLDTYCNSLTSGLPREIELREKQYQYYRDLLLGFGRE